MRLFKKFALVYTSVLIVAILIVTVGVNQILENRIFKVEADRLIQNADKFNDVAEQFYLNNQLTPAALKAQIDLFDHYNGATVWLVNKDSYVFMSSNSDISEENRPTVSMEELETIFDGKIFAKKHYFEGLMDGETLTVAYPVTYNGEVMYAMILNVPMPKIKLLTQGVFTIVMYSLLISFGIALLIIFSITSQMKREIVTLRDAAKHISEGNFEQKILVRSNDELSELAESFNEMADELSRSEKMKSQFISNLSHDIRSPLTSIKGYTQGMLDGVIEGDKQERYLRIVRDESDRLLKMANDILDLSKMESGQIQLTKRDFDLNNMIVNVLDRFETQIIDKRIKLSIDLYKDSILAHGDEQYLQRVIHNLIDNAVKFVDVEGTISIRSEIKADKLLVGVSNTGHVLSPDELLSIWGRFSKLDQSRGMDKKSSGLGLSIVREIVKAHDEKIEVYSNDDIGVAFLFSIEKQVFK